MTDGVTLDGHKELIKKMKKLPYRMQTKYLQKAVRVAGTKTRDYAKSIAPVGTGANKGNLKRSLMVAKTPVKYSGDRASVLVGYRQNMYSMKRVPYFIPIEYGSYKMPAQPV